MNQAELEGLLGALRAFGVTKYETPDICLELQPHPVTAVFGDAAAPPALGAEEDDFDPAKAYQQSIDEAAEAIRVAAAKRE